jgi:sugar lactone lactonase YvrE
MRPRHLLPLVLAAAACAPQPTAIAVDIEAPGLTISSLTMTARLASGASTTRELAPRLPGRVVLQLPDVAQQVTVTLHAVDANHQTWDTVGSIDSVPHHEQTLGLVLGTIGPDLAPPSDMSMLDLDLSTPPDIPRDLSGPILDMLVPNGASLTLLAGEPGSVGDADGRGSAARFEYCSGIVLAGTTLYTVDNFSGKLRQIDPATGDVTTVHLVDGNGIDTSLNFPRGLAWDGADALYVSEQLACDIKRVKLSTHEVSLVVGNPGSCGFADGVGTAAQLSGPNGLAFDAHGALWVADENNFAVRIVGVGAMPGIGTVAGRAGGGNSAVTDGTGTINGSARFADPVAVTVVGSNVYVADGTAIRVIDTAQAPTASSFVTTVVQPGHWGALGGLVAGDNGSILAIDRSVGLIRRVVPGMPPVLSIVAGGDVGDPLDGPGTSARIGDASFFAPDGQGHAWFTDASSVRRLTIGGTWDVVTVAGASEHSGDVDVPLRLDNPMGLAWDGNDLVYVSDYRGNRIRAYRFSTGQLSTVAGNGMHASTPGGVPTASFGGPTGLALDNAGNLWVSDYDTNVIRKLNLQSGEVQNLATGMPYKNPNGMVFDGGHLLYISDAGNHVVRTLDITNSATEGVLAGTYGTAGEKDAPATQALFNSPHGLALDRARNLLYVADYGGSTVRRIDLGASDKAVSTVAGIANGPGFTDGPANMAQFLSPLGLSFDPVTRMLYLADGDNNRVRRIDLGALTVSTYVGGGRQRTLPGPLPADVRAPWSVLVTPRGLLITSWIENSLLLAK